MVTPYPQPVSFQPSKTDADTSAKTLRSTLVSRNVTIAGHRTSVRLEPEMWSGLTDICRRERASMHDVCTAVAHRKDENTSLTAAIRVFVMSYYRAASTDEGHIKVNHGYGLALVPGKIGTAHPPQSQQTLPPNAVAMPRASSPYMNGSGGNNGGMR